MERREFLRRSGVAAGTGLYATVGTGSAVPAEGSLPNTETDHVDIRAKRQRHTDTPRRVPDDTWVVHRISVATEGSEPPRDLRTVRDVPDMRFYIDEERIDEARDHWDSISERDDGTYETEWTYAVPPRSTGRHTFRVEVGFPSPVVTGHGTPHRTVWSGTSHFDATYEVVPRADYRSGCRQTRRSLGEVDR